MVLVLDIEVSENNKTGDIERILEHVRPHWRKRDIVCSELCGGNTNQIFHSKSNKNNEDVVLFKLYGYLTETYINREKEIEVMEMLHKHDRGPEVYCRFKNGIAYGYLHGIALELDMLPDPYFSRLIAQEFAELHHIPLERGAKAELFDKLQLFLNMIPDSFTDPVQQKLFLQFPRKTELRAQIKDLEEKLVKVTSPVVFCHNDVIFSNVICNKAKNVVRFIDYEYAFPNFQAFDLADHFCEFSGLETYDGAYPSQEFQITWLNIYLKKRYELLNQPCPPDEVAKLYNQVDKFSMIPDLLWCMWAIFQARHENGNIDFLSYSVKRMHLSYFTKFARVYPEVYEKHLLSHQRCQP